MIVFSGLNVNSKFCRVNGHFLRFDVVKIVVYNNFFRKNERTSGCCGSGVEHVLGKDGVMGSIPISSLGMGTA